MGEFFKPERPTAPHTCRLPDASAVFSGEEGWRCDCGKAYVKETVSQHGETWRQWRRAPEFDASSSPHHEASDSASYRQQRSVD